MQEVQTTNRRTWGPCFKSKDVTCLCFMLVTDQLAMTACKLESLGSATICVVPIGHMHHCGVLCTEAGDAQALLASKKLSKTVSLVRKVKDVPTAALPDGCVYIYCGKYEVGSAPADYIWSLLTYAFQSDLHDTVLASILCTCLHHLDFVPACRSCMAGRYATTPGTIGMSSYYGLLGKTV